MVKRNRSRLKVRRILGDLIQLEILLGWFAWFISKMNLAYLH